MPRLGCIEGDDSPVVEVHVLIAEPKSNSSSSYSQFDSWALRLHS